MILPCFHTYRRKQKTRVCGLVDKTVLSTRGHMLRMRRSCHTRFKLSTHSYFNNLSNQLRLHTFTVLTSINVSNVRGDSRTHSLSIGAHGFINLDWWSYPVHTLLLELIILWGWKSAPNDFLKRVSSCAIENKFRWDPTCEQAISCSHVVYRQTLNSLSCNIVSFRYTRSLTVHLFEFAAVGVFEAGTMSTATSVLLRKKHRIQVKCFQSEHFHIVRVKESS